MRKIKTEILIIGGGPAGLMMATMAARHQCQFILIEKHEVSSIFPKARIVNVRTMELLRNLNLEASVRKAELPESLMRYIYLPSLKEKLITQINIDFSIYKPHSPTMPSFVQQEYVQSVLLENLKTCSSDIRFSHELQSFYQKEDKVIATLCNKKNGEILFVEASYMIAADGAQSFVREQIPIAMKGVEKITELCSVLCEIDFSSWIEKKSCICMNFVRDQGDVGYALNINGKNQWLFVFETNNKKAFFDDQYCVAKVRELLQAQDLAIKFIDKKIWFTSAQVAEKYNHNNIFLIGDACHVVPTTGGFGMNAGIQDAYNLSWKLAGVLKKWASKSLLDSYFIEREPIAHSIINWSKKNYQRFNAIINAIIAKDDAQLTQKIQEQRDFFCSIGQDIGFTYAAGALISDGSSIQAHSPTSYIPSAHAGARAPHVWLTDDHKKSSLDLFGWGFVLVYGLCCKDIANGIAHTFLQRGVPFTQYCIEEKFKNIAPHFLTVYGISNHGFVLIRPDGYVAWREVSASNLSESQIKNAIDQLVGVNPQ